MDIVDSQIHFGPGGVEEIISAMDALGIRSALVDEAWLGVGGQMPHYRPADGLRRMVAPTAEMASLMHPDRFSFLLRIDRRDPEMSTLIRLAGQNGNARALRISPGLTKSDIHALGTGGFDELFTAAADAGLPIFIAIPGNAPILRPSIEKFPNLQFVIDHCGLPVGKAALEGTLKSLGWNEQPPEICDDIPETALTNVLKLADFPNVSIKWAHTQKAFKILDYPFAGLRPHLRSAITAFGADRIMWASDISTQKSGNSWAELLFWLTDNPDLSQFEREAILGGTARRILNWTN